MQRFFDKIIKDSCWIWTGGSRGAGYGAIKVDGKVIDAHRYSYKLHKGDIPEGMYVCHSCDNRRCVNPDHLFLGTPKDNWKDAVDKGRIIPVTNPKKHPSIGAYNRGCRCEECTVIKSAALKRYRAKNKS